MVVATVVPEHVLTKQQLILFTGVKGSVGGPQDETFIVFAQKHLFALCWRLYLQ